MYFYRRLVSGLLCIAMLLSLTACGQSDSAKETIDGYLTAAQEFVNAGDLDAAVAALEQAKSVKENARIDEMLTQITAMLGTPMTLEYTATEQTDDVTVHSMYAYLQDSGIVHFAVHYTAKKGTKLHLSGNGLYYDGDFLTTGERDRFVFEIPVEEVRKLDSFSLIFIHNGYEICCTVVSGFNENSAPEETLLQRSTEQTAVPKLMPVSVRYPEPVVIVTALDVFPTIIDRDDDPNNVGIYRFAALELSTGVVRFVVDYIAPKGMDFVVSSDNLLYQSSFTATGNRDRFVFDLDAEATKRLDKLSIEFGGYPDGVYLFSIQLGWPDPSAGANLPMLSDGNPVGESVDLAFETDGDITVQQLSRQYLDNQCFRYTLEVSAPEALTMQITGPNGQVYHQPVTTTAEPVKAVFDLPWSVAALNPQIHVGFTDGQGNLLHSVSAWNGLIRTGEETTCEPYSMGYRLEYDWWNYDISDPHTVAIHSCTRQDLTNGFLRYCVSFTAPKGMSLEVSIGYDKERVIPNDRFLMNTGAVTTGEYQTVMFDLKQDSFQNIYPVLSFSASGKHTEYLPIFASAELQLSDGNPIGEEMKQRYIGNDFRPRKDVQIHDFTAQPLDNEMVRFKLTYTAPKGVIIKWNCKYAGGLDDYYTVVTEEGEQILRFDLRFEQLQELYDFLIMFYDENKARFVLPTYVNVTEWGVSPKKQETIHLTEVEYPGGFAKSGLYLDDIVREIEDIVRELFDFAPFVPENTESVDTSMIHPLEVSRQAVKLDSSSGITPYGQYYIEPFPADADLTNDPALAYAISFSDTTTFSEKMPAGFDREALLEWGKAPGLHVNVLHELGYTGKGAVVAYVDQAAAEHEAYDGGNVRLNNDTKEATSMHGPSVLSLLAGKEIGTAPDAVVHYYANDSVDHKGRAEQLYEIIEYNKTLPQDEKITMVGFSVSPDNSFGNLSALEDAVAACEKAGIMVWFCDDYGAASFLPLSDKDNVENMVRDYWYKGTPELVFVPTGGRTTATGERGEYIYWSSSGLSWTMPYALGLYAIATEINPDLTQADLRTMIVDTAYIRDDMKIINPIGFVAAALESAGRVQDAEVLRAAANDNEKYTYAVMNKSKMSAEDITAAENYLKEISDSTVLVMDSSEIGDARTLYTTLQVDHMKRGGVVDGVQIFGDVALVPSFEVGYRADYVSDNGLAVDEMGTLYTDLFYGNFDNNADDLSKSYNVKDHFANDWQVQLTPQWPVARLPLAKGEFAPFFRKYRDFMEQTGLAQQNLVNFSNPTAAQIDVVDDMGHFMNRMNEEFNLLDIPYRLYGNQLGQYPVHTEILGGFTAENLTAENQKSICEFIINTHGQKDNLDKCWFENGQEKRESLMNMNTINSVLGDHYYYLDTMSCNNGEGMQDNMTVAALNGNCVGMFSATHVTSGNGQNNEATVQELTEGKFFYFWLHYLNALNEGASRSDAFYIAQKHYANSLLAHSRNGIQAEGNYQFNLYNLIAYHNFGVLEPSRAFSYINSAIN